MSKNKAQVNEGVLDDMDEDGWMAKSQLYQTAKMAIELHKMIQDTDNLEPWVQSKITKAADYLDSVRRYMEYEAVNSYPGEATEEAPVEVKQESRIRMADLADIDQAWPKISQLKMKLHDQGMEPEDAQDAAAEKLGYDPEMVDHYLKYKFGESNELDEGEVVGEAFEKDEVMAIMKKHPQDVARMNRDGDINTASGLFTALYRYYLDSGEMPYGVAKAREGDPVEWIMDRLDDMGLMESQIDEGYESSVLRVMKDHGISAYFSNGVMYVDAMDMDKAKEALELDSDITELPKMVAEKAKESIGSDTEDLWMEKLAAAGLKSATEGRMSDVAAAADEVATMIEGGATDQEIMDHTGLNTAQVKFLRNSLQDRPAQYEGNYPSKLPKTHKNYKAQQAAVAISKQGG
jgi:hypothetical protein|tara:strand:- start:2274 stop:3488 length:1215 start_codon:yes stop_codon:yes gene_type:complete